MTYKEYLRFCRKLERVKRIVRAAGHAVTVVGLLVVMIAVGGADASPVLPVVTTLCAGLALMVVGSLPEFIR